MSMTRAECFQAELQKATRKYVTVTSGGAGWFAIVAGWYEADQMWDCIEKGVGRYATQQEAEEEAREWAEELELPFGPERTRKS